MLSGVFVYAAVVQGGRLALQHLITAVPRLLSLCAWYGPGQLLGVMWVYLCLQGFHMLAGYRQLCLCWLQTADTGYSHGMVAANDSGVIK